MQLRPTWTLVTLLACATTPPRPSPLAPPAPAPPALASPAPATPIARLATRRVHHDDYARRVLYTWTTPPQIAALRATRRLLVAEAGVGTGPSPFLRALADLAHPLAAHLLEHPDLRRRRYAWTSPFATTMGLGPIRYGDALIRVELAPHAVIVRFRPGDREPLAAVDLRGAAVPLAELVADPRRIAAVYHVRDDPREPVAYREYVLCNEAAIAAWSIATPEIRAQVDDDIDLLTALADGPLAVVPAAAVDTSPAPAWPTARPDPTPIDHWHASLAFANPHYRPSPSALAAIVATLEQYDGAGEPLTHAIDHTAQSSHTAR